MYLCPLKGVYDRYCREVGELFKQAAMVPEEGGTGVGSAWSKTWERGRLARLFQTRTAGGTPALPRVCD